MLGKYNNNKSLYRKEEVFEKIRQLSGESPANIPWGFGELNPNLSYRNFTSKTIPLHPPRQMKQSTLYHLPNQLNLVQNMNQLLPLNLQKKNVVR
ncbi:hypothetical protein INT46_008448 [Mucor plumbeus]|uniref:Uncharacterized protein n=1 Tax=Mucor plumbeus TaxID=97098 RepID=A0A8H7V838_9FUNG|nr:hypothetical protein INT46_008448 [Mucor plumbeus]